MNLVRFNSLLFLLLFSIISSGQSGYLGKLNSFEVKVGVVPSIRVVSKLDGDYTARKAKIINPNVSFSLTRVIAKNFEIGAGYFYSNIQCSSDRYLLSGGPSINYYGSVFGEVSFMDEPKIAHHGGYLAFNFYRLGCLAPIGKYIGFSVSFAQTTIDTTDYFVIGIRDEDKATDGFFKSKYDILYSDSISISTKNNISSKHLKMRIGRNYPLTEFLMLSVGMSIPIFSVYSSNSYNAFGFQVDNNSSYSVTGDWSRYAAQAIKSYHRITFEASLRLVF